MKNTDNRKLQLRKRTHDCNGSVSIVTLGIIAILLMIVGITMQSTANKYLTAYQWASWQEALQGAESGADIAMIEMRKDMAADSSKPAWVGWRLGKYVTVNGKKVKDSDSSHHDVIGSDGSFANNHGNGVGNGTEFNMLQPDGT